MMKIFDKDHNAIGHIVKYKDRKIECDVETGDESLSFTYLAKRHNLTNEMYIQTKESEYVIKETSESTDGFPQIVAALNLEELEAQAWQTFSVTDVTINEAARIVLAGTGWTIGECNVTKRRNAGMIQVSSLGVIQNLCTAFMCEPVFDTIRKTVSFYEQRGKDKGVYFIRGLNLKKLQKKSSSYDFYTRIIPIGADDLTIESVNDGKNYLENFQYSEKVRTYIWKDDSYTDPQALMEDAAKKLNDLSKPETSYSVDVRDLANQKPEYSILSYDLGDTVTLIDPDTGIRDQQRIKRMTKYPDNPEKNSCEIANTFLTFEEMQDKLRAAADIVNYAITADGKIYVSDILNFEKGVSDSVTVAGIKDSVNTVQGNVTTIQGNILTMQGDIAEAKVKIGEIVANSLTAEEADLKYATITSLEATDAEIHSLRADYGDFRTATTNELSAHRAVIDDLDSTYASIDFANINVAGINVAKVGELFAKVGLLTTAVIQDGHVTGYLDAVEVNANNITAGTLVVDRLYLKGEYDPDKGNSILYQLNYDPEKETINASTLDGDILTERTVTADKIVAHSITADEITTSDIVGANGWINLADATFNYGGQLIWDGSKLTIAADAITIITDSKYTAQEKFEQNVSVTEQNSEYISWLIASGESAADFMITDRLAELTASYINLHGVINISGISENALNALTSSGLAIVEEDPVLALTHDGQIIQTDDGTDVYVNGVSILAFASPDGGDGWGFFNGQRITVPEFTINLSSDVFPATNGYIVQRIGGSGYAVWLDGDSWKSCIADESSGQSAWSWKSATDAVLARYTKDPQGTVTYELFAPMKTYQEIKMDAMVSNWAAGAIDEFTCINGGLIMTNTIIAEALAAGSVTTDKLATNAVTAEKIDVNDLFTKNITATNMHITGSSTFDGIITARAGGTIGGFDIGDTYIASGTNTISGEIESVYLGKEGISCGQIFTISNKGKVTLKGAGGRVPEIEVIDNVYEERSLRIYGTLIDIAGSNEKNSITLSLNGDPPDSEAHIFVGSYQGDFSEIANGDIRCKTVTQTSDERKKDIIHWDDNSDAFIMNIEPIMFRWKEGTDQAVHVGIGAQSAIVLLEGLEMENCGMVVYDKERDSYGVNYSELPPLMIPTIQKNRQLIVDTQKEIACMRNAQGRLEDKNKSLKFQLGLALTRIAALEKEIETLQLAHGA